MTREELKTNVFDVLGKEYLEYIKTAEYAKLLKEAKEYVPSKEEAELLRSKNLKDELEYASTCIKSLRKLIEERTIQISKSLSIDAKMISDVPENELSKADTLISEKDRYTKDLEMWTSLFSTIKRYRTVLFSGDYKRCDKVDTDAFTLIQLIRRSKSAEDNVRGFIEFFREKHPEIVDAFGEMEQTEDYDKVIQELSKKFIISYSKTEDEVLILESMAEIGYIIKNALSILFNRELRAELNDLDDNYKKLVDDINTKSQEALVELNVNFKMSELFERYYKLCCIIKDIVAKVEDLRTAIKKETSEKANKIHDILNLKDEDLDFKDLKVSVDLTTQDNFKETFKSVYETKVKTTKKVLVAMAINNLSYYSKMINLVSKVRRSETDIDTKVDPKVLFLESLIATYYCIRTYPVEQARSLVVYSTK